jgi:signal transduction histidine kinase
MAEAVRERAEAANPEEALILLQSRYGQAIAGNVLRYRPFTGWRELSLRRTEHANGGSEEDENALALGVRLDDAFLMVGRSVHHIEETQELLVRSLAWALAMTVGFAIVGGAVFSSSALRRVETINRTFKEISNGDLAVRVPTRGTRDELDLLATNINLLLGRIENLLQNLQQVTNDIAHDLRTPLGRLRQDLEALRLKKGRGEDYEGAIDHAIGQVDTILDTFAALLRIAQIESRARRSRFADVDLSEVLNRIVDAYESVVEDAGQSFVADIAPNVHVQGDRELLTQLVANLVENAMRHSPPGIQVSVSLSADPVPKLIVGDTGPGIPDDMRNAVLRRFARLEGSRTTPGSGLGLALVKAIADLHDGEMTLSDNAPGLRVCLQFPALIKR